MSHETSGSRSLEDKHALYIALQRASLIPQAGQLLTFNLRLR